MQQSVEKNTFDDLAIQETVDAFEKVLEVFKVSDETTEAKRLALFGKIARKRFGIFEGDKLVGLDTQKLSLVLQAIREHDKSGILQNTVFTNSEGQEEALTYKTIARYIGERAETVSEGIHSQYMKAMFESHINIKNPSVAEENKDFANESDPHKTTKKKVKKTSLGKASLLVGVLAAGIVLPNIDYNSVKLNLKGPFREKITNLFKSNRQIAVKDSLSRIEPKLISKADFLKNGYEIYKQYEKGIVFKNQVGQLAFWGSGVDNYRSRKCFLEAVRNGDISIPGTTNKDDAKSIEKAAINFLKTATIKEDIYYFKI